MKQIAILVSTLNSGGAEKQAVLLAIQLSLKLSVDLIVLYGDWPEYKKNIDLLNASTVNVHKMTGGMVGKILKLRSILKQNKTDVMLCYLTMPDVVGSLVGKISGVKVYNGIRNSRLPKAKMLMERWAHNHWATGTIFNCYSGAEYFSLLGFRNDKNIVIPNCYPDIAENIERGDKNIKTIITVGRFDPQKDYETLIKTVSLISRNDYCLRIVGYGSLEEQIRDWVTKYGIQDKTEFHIKPDNVPELERDADIYLSTSLFEGTSNSIMEALNWSLPVVATNVGDNDHLIIEGKNGYLHSVGDAMGMAASLDKLLASVDLRNQMGKEGNKNLCENYSMEIFEKRYMNLIEK